MIKELIPEEICLACQGCCRFKEKEDAWCVWLLDTDIQELLKNNIPPSLISGAKKLRLKEHKGENNFICPFLNTPDNKCKIYSFRPFECRLYPFLLQRANNKVFLGIDLKCPFVKANLKSQGFKEHTQYLTGLLNTSTWLNILRNNLGVIRAYEGILALAELKV